MTGHWRAVTLAAVLALGCRLAAFAQAAQDRATAAPEPPTPKAAP